VSRPSHGGLARLALVVLVAAAVVVIPQVASAALVDETELAERYVPVVRLVAQAQDCGYGEPYEPIEVDVLFDQSTVSLRGPWNPTDLVKIGPVAADLPGLYEYHLDFPGNALDAGCDYERWANRLTGDTKPAAYAHVATDPGHPGQLALQYWLYYIFNDWNNTHEGDWEMVQLVFDADDAREALSRKPVAVGYSQHEGAERATWGEDKLEVVGDTHPVVYPAAGSHANFFESALFLGKSAEQGVGCDDTSGPSVDVRPVVRTISSDRAEAEAAFPWIRYEGRWGELQRGIFNGPTGPNLKSQWTEPIRWSEDWRDRSYAIPGGGAFGTGATDFFCDVVAAGSRAVKQLAADPLPVLVALVVVLALAVFALSRATWRPTAPFRLARRRAWGQILAGAGRMYVARLPLFVGIGLVLLPLSVVLTFLQALVLSASRVIGIETEGESGGVLVIVVVAIGTAFTLLGLGLVMAATVRALVEIDEGRKIGPVRAYRLAFESVRSLLGALMVAAILLSLLLGSLILAPIAIWLAVRWALVVPAVELENLSAIQALRRSGRLVRLEWLKVASLAVVGGALAVAAGPLVGALLIVVTDVPLALLNVVAGVVYAVAMPFVALTTAYLYFDARVREALATDREPELLPAEIELST
jgi:hypothetical protein